MLIRIYLLISFLTVLLTAEAQSHFPLFPESPQWKVKEGTVWGNGIPTYSTPSYSFIGEDSLCGFNYSVIKIDNDTTYIRNEGQKTWIRKFSDCSTPELLMYDFSVTTGQTLYVGYIDNYSSDLDTNLFQVHDVWWQDFQGIQRKVIHLKYGPLIGDPPGRDMLWIEGVGSNVHPFYPKKCLWDGCEEIFKTICYDSSGVHLYTNPEFLDCYGTWNGTEEYSAASNLITCYPNPATDILNVEVSDNCETIRIEDISGRIVLEKAITSKSETILISHLPKGVYIVKTIGSHQQSFSRFSMI